MNMHCRLPSKGNGELIAWISRYGINCKSILHVCCLTLGVLIFFGSMCPSMSAEPPEKLRALKHNTHCHLNFTKKYLNYSFACPNHLHGRDNKKNQLFIFSQVE